MPTIRDVAHRAGVSVGTASAVVNGRPGVSADLRQRVQRAITDLGYRPNLQARALNTKRTQTLALLVPSIANPFFSAVLHAAEAAAHARDYSVFVCNTDGDPGKADRYRDRLIAMGVDGVLAVMSWDIAAGDLVPSLTRAGVPVVGVAGARPLPQIDCFVSDDEGGGELAGRYLLGLGHRGIAFVGATESHTTEMRYAGLCRALSAAGIPPDPRLLVRTDGYSEEAAAAATEELLASGVPFTAVVAFNDVMALGVLGAMEGQGLHVPASVSLVGFDDTVSAYARPQMTTVACPKDALGQRAVERLLARIEDPAAEPRTHRLPCRLILRASTKALR